MSYKTPATFLLFGVLAACQTKEPVDAGELPDSTPKGTLRVSVTGGENEVNSSVEEVWLRIEDVQVRHEEMGWISLETDRQDLDLMAGIPTEQELAESEVPEGSYTRMKLLVADSWIVVDGQERDLTIQSDLVGDVLAEGIDFDETFFVDEGSTTSLLIDWDLGNQLQDDQGEWNLGTAGQVDVSLETD